MAFASGTDTTIDRETKGWRFAVTSGILGWVLDAFDFFVLVFLFDALAPRFHVSKASVVYTLTLTLAMRPLGALFFGALADRFGRRCPLIVCVLYFSLCTVITGLAPNFTVFAVCRALYGIGMGGYWGIGASYAMESSPRRFRGVLSGLMQAGYPMGYLLASVAIQTLTPGVRLASRVLRGSAGRRADCLVDAVRAGVRSLAAASPGFSQKHLRHHGRTQGNISLPAADDGRDDGPHPRHAGPLSRLPELASGYRHQDYCWDAGAIWDG